MNERKQPTITYEDDGSMTIHDVDAMDEDAFLHVMTEFFFGTKMADAVVAAGDPKSRRTSWR